MGSRYHPINALVCLCAMSSAICSALCFPLVSPGAKETWIQLAVVFFYLAAFITSAIGAVSLLIVGADGVGSIVIRGRAVPALPLWTGYLVIYLLPWLGLLARLLRL